MTINSGDWKENGGLKIRQSKVGKMEMSERQLGIQIWKERRVGDCRIEEEIWDPDFKGQGINKIMWGKTMWLMTKLQGLLTLEAWGRRF